VVSAAPGLRERSQVKASGLRIDRELGDTAPADWAGEIETVVVPGGLGFREVAFLLLLPLKDRTGPPGLIGR